MSATKTTESYDAMQARLTRAFNLVKPATHWKDRIDAVVDTATLVAIGSDMSELREAVIHFTATTPTMRHIAGGLIRVEADGYRAGPAGDR